MPSPSPPRRAHGVSESAPTSERENDEISITVNNSDGAATTRNVLKFSLETLSTISANIPFSSGLSAVIEPLLTIVDHIKQTSSNAQGLIELAARIELLTPVILEMAENPRGSEVIERLQRELESITTDLEAAWSQGELNQFFNSDDNTSSLQTHNMTLAQLIADSTMVTVREVLNSVQESQRSKFQFNSDAMAPTFELGDITGGVGGAGSSGGRIGGQGGDGEGPKVDMDPQHRWKMGDVSGGTGGHGGHGMEVGGQGGVGRGPVITYIKPESRP
ncbi:hypothetical protein B0H16DRAFT_1610693 [Mycena metata]|uniref:Uncharacterized protein n=1 Tax=Mycena metata TaxID=1033252 RepID=A0AAD7HCI3_9AGAR|nr:hypothetical protein B0H16DRAFT_1610693 [Mycena metata]